MSTDRYYIVDRLEPDAYLLRETTDQNGVVTRKLTVHLEPEFLDFEGIAYLKNLVEAANHE